MTKIDTLPLFDKLKNKIYAYYQTIWKDKWRDKIDEEWLNNFNNVDPDILDKERVNMLYLLSKFMYFGNEQIRHLLFSLFRDLFKYPIIAKIRKSNSDTIDLGVINPLFKEELNCTRFLGVGNPSESGVHMLYYFRQECKLKKNYFINASEIFSIYQETEVLKDGSKISYLKSKLTNKKIKRYVFIDDFCGSGSQAKDYLKQIVENIKFEDTKIEVYYYMLFGTDFGINEVRNLKLFDSVEAVFTLDDSFKAFSSNSRYFNVPLDIPIEKLISENTAYKYGANLYNPPLGFGNCQLLLGLFHNTPDNTLPIFWSEENDWKPIFKRYHKIY